MLAGEGFLLLAIFFLPACAPNDPPPIQSNPTIICDSSEEAEAQPSREAVFVYGEGNKNNPQKLIIGINAEPVQIDNAYVRLVGIINGATPVALVEMGGKGQCVGLGEKLAGYQIVVISIDHVELRNTRE